MAELLRDETPRLLRAVELLQAGTAMPDASAAPPWQNPLRAAPRGGERRATPDEHALAGPMAAEAGEPAEIGAELARAAIAAGDAGAPRGSPVRAGRR